MNTFMNETLLAIIYIFISYLVGSFPTGILYSKYIHQVDVRTLGSGNSGATNVGRSFGFKAAVIVSVVDALKGFIPVLLAKNIFPNQHIVIMLVGIACIIGHAYPIFAGFRGGKIMATSVGILFAYNFALGIFTVALFGVILFLTSTVSLASITSYSIMALFVAITNPIWAYKIGFIFMGLFLIYRHRENIDRLINRNENRINWGLRANDKNK